MWSFFNSIASFIAKFWDIFDIIGNKFTAYKLERTRKKLQKILELQQAEIGSMTQRAMFNYLAYGYYRVNHVGIRNGLSETIVDPRAHYVPGSWTVSFQWDELNKSIPTDYYLNEDGVKLKKKK